MTASELDRDPLARLRERIEEATRSVGDPPSAPTLSRPPRAEMGDYSSNAAMILAGAVPEAPRDVAARIASQLEESMGELAVEIEVAGPGFINFHLADAWYQAALSRLAAAIEKAWEEADPLFGLGPTEVSEPDWTLVEFVSANPTGPLTAASGRHAAYGDAIARLIEATGHKVRREYYVNDAGGQISRLASSVAALMIGEDVPEDGYRGGYVSEIASRLSEPGKVKVFGEGEDGEISTPVSPGDLDTLGRAAVSMMLQSIEATVEAYGVTFDQWISERDLHERASVDQAMELLSKAGHTYDADGALWLRTTEFGDDKDRVLIRANGEPTYFAADVAYHTDKLERGYDHLIDVLGADHHGYVGRMKAAVECLGADPDRFEAPIMQMVSVIEQGQRAQMSKRSGEFVTLGELIEDIGTDATRYFMLQRSHDTPIDLDLDLARSQSNDNPVYYVEYAHARIASILRKAVTEGAISPSGSGADHRVAGADTEMTAAEAAVLGAWRILDDGTGVGLEPTERALVKRLLEFPAEVSEAAERRAPHRICAYATAIASDFHGFYRDCKVVGATGGGVQEFRLALCLVTKKTLAATLGLLGITAPERM